MSTRRVEGLVQTLGMDGASRRRVSQMAQHLDAEVQTFRSRPLDAGPYTYLWIDALAVKVREDRRTQNVSVMLATAVNRDGQREVLGIGTNNDTTGASWLAFLCGLVARGLSGVQLTVSAAHRSLTSSLAAALPRASWQRCRTHFAANLARVPRSAQPVVAGLLRSVFDQPGSEQIHVQFDRVTGHLGERFPAVADYLADAKYDLLAFTAFPVEHWTKIGSNNQQGRLNMGIRRRTDGVGIPGPRQPVPADQGSPRRTARYWSVGHRYLSSESLAKGWLRAVPGAGPTSALPPPGLPAGGTAGDVTGEAVSGLTPPPRRVPPT